MPHVNNKVLFYTASGPWAPLTAAGWRWPGSRQVFPHQASHPLRRTLKGTPFIASGN